MPDTEIRHASLQNVKLALIPAIIGNPKRIQETNQSTKCFPSNFSEKLSPRMHKKLESDRDLHVAMKRHS